MIKSIIYNYLVDNITYILEAFLLLIIGWILIFIIVSTLKRLFKRIKIEEILAGFVVRSIKVFLWVILFTIVLAQLGVNISGIIAGLSVFGVALGFAIRDLFSNFIAGIFILLYRPFKLGDKVEVGGEKGTLKEINMYTCELVGPRKQQIIVPNAKIWSEPIKIGGKAVKKRKVKKKKVAKK